MKNFAYNVRWLFLIALGCAVFALGFNLFLEPNGLSAGGISGIALIIIHLAPITTVGIATALMNFPLFFFGGKKIGMRFFVGSIFGTVFFSLFIDLFAGIPVPETEKFQVFLAQGQGLFHPQPTVKGLANCSRLEHAHHWAPERERSNTRVSTWNADSCCATWLGARMPPDTNKHVSSEVNNAEPCRA